MDERYSGTKYSDLYGNWDMVVVQVILKIVLKDIEVERNIITNDSSFGSVMRGQARIAANSIDMMFYTKVQQLN